MKAPETQLMAENMALRWLARREYGRVELARKLAARGVAPDLASDAVAALASRGMQSEDRYARALAQARLRRGYGPLRILAELRAGGVDEEVAAAAVDALDVDWVGAARAWYQRHYDATPADDKARMLAEQTLRRRGFTDAQVRALRDDLR